jgi:hypothetical protein
MTVTSTSVFAQTNSWINLASGSWDDATSWSLGVLPDSSQSVMITNSGFKAVAINPSTPVNFPGSMTVSSLTIQSPTNSENTLLLNYFGTSVPLTVLNGLTLQDNAQILNFNSGLVVQSGTITVTNSQINQDGGYIGTLNAPMNLNGSVYNLTNGLFQGGSVTLGSPSPADFNQYGGTALITNLIFVGGASYTGGHYALYGGELDLPNGLTIINQNNESSSYLQAGGTNLTTSVFLEPGLFGDGPAFTLNGGLLADNKVSILADPYGSVTLTQNGGTHIVTNLMNIAGAAHTLSGPPESGAYQLNGGTLSVGSITMDASGGPAVFNQTNGTAQIGAIQGSSGGSGNSYWVTAVNLSGGTLSCSNLFITDGGNIEQFGGALSVSSTLSVVGFFNPGRTYYTEYDFIGGTLAANNINIGGIWIIGDGSSRISNPGTCSLSHTLVISNATEQLGGFILASNATIDLAGSASRLSFANSSGQTWAGGATLVITDWNGNLSGGGTEQLKFGTDQTGLTSAQLSQVQFNIGTNLFPAKILSTGEVVPNQGSSSGSGQTNSWVNAASGNWDDAASWSLGILPNSSQLVMITNSGSKAVAINPSTPANFPGSMTVSNLTIQGSTNTVNTLLLNNFGTATPLTVLNGLTVSNNGQILNMNSGLVVQSGTINVTNSQINQDGGFILTTNTQMNLIDSVYNLTNGDFEGGSVAIGLPVSARFNQYGGTATITNLGLESQTAGTIQNGISLYGGTLNLPGGMFLAGGPGGLSYFQTGGTNLTTGVVLERGYGGATPTFTLNGGLLADSSVQILGGGPQILAQNGGSHVITNSLSIDGQMDVGAVEAPAIYQLNGGTLSAGTLELDADQGNSLFVQSNGTTSVGTVYAHSVGYYTENNTTVTLSGGTLTCLNFTIDDGGGQLNQSGGALVVSNLLAVGGSRNAGIPNPIYGTYTFTGGALSASNINITGIFSIGDGSTNRISNPGTFGLSYTLVISNAVEQLGRFILASNAVINLAGSASRLSFANSSGQAWSSGGMLLVSNWNGNPSGGGAEQLKFGTDQTGLTQSQLRQIEFSLGTNIYSAKILNTGEVVPNQAIAPPITYSTQGKNLILTWPSGYTLQTATNATGPYTNISGATSPYTNSMTDPRRFFRIAQ